MYKTDCRRLDVVERATVKYVRCRPSRSNSVLKRAKMISYGGPLRHDCRRRIIISSAVQRGFGRIYFRMTYGQ